MITRNECPLCNSKRGNLVFQLEIDNNFIKFIDSYYGNGAFSAIKPYLDNCINYHKCLNCHMTYQSNILSDEGMLILYEKLINPHNSLHKRLSLSIDQNFNSIKFCRSLLNELGKTGDVAKKTIVDIGMGFGQTLSQFKALGAINSYGIELSPCRIDFAQNTYGIKCRSSITDFDNSSVDLMIANQSLEHIPNLRETLDHIEKKLIIGGLVFIAVPNGSKAFSTCNKGPFQPLEHINSFTSISKNFLFSKNMKPVFRWKNCHPKYNTTWLFRKTS